jgi:flagellar hook protein FlgE
MSILDAINSALSGLDAQAAQLGNISNNVANSSTVGYKEADTDFESLVLGGAGISGSTDLSGVTNSTQMDIGTAGQITTTGVSTDIAINGSGFMVVNTAANPANGSTLLTQAGSFRPDANGNLVNAAGYYLQGQPLDANGNPVGGAASTLGGLSTVNVANLQAAAQPTTTMTFDANLPSGDTAYANPAPSPSTSSVTYYDPLGNANTLQFQFVPTQPSSSTGAATNTWTMNIYDSATSSTTPVGSATLTFNATGADAGTLASVTPASGAGTYDPTAGTFAITTASGQTLPINIGALNSPSGLTQLNGAYTATNVQQNGAPFGLLQGVSVGSNGVVTASFSNGSTRPIYQVDLATVPNPDGLTPVTGDAFALSSGSGVPLLQTPGTGSAGTTEGGALEGSNVDITTQLTNMIETQRAYSSNAMVVQTADQMLSVIDQINQ